MNFLSLPGSYLLYHLSRDQDEVAACNSLLSSFLLFLKMNATGITPVLGHLSQPLLFYKDYQVALAMTISSSLSTCGWIPSEPSDLCMSYVFPDLIHFQQVYIFISPDFALVFLKADLACKVWGEDTIQDRGLFHILYHCSLPPLFSRRLKFYLVFFCHLCTYRSPSCCPWHPWPD